MSISQEQAMKNLRISQNEKKRKENKIKWRKSMSREALIAAFQHAQGKYLFSGALALRARISL